jgi:uncharacterized protein (TIRG00374 family)
MTRIEQPGRLAGRRLMRAVTLSTIVGAVAYLAAIAWTGWSGVRAGVGALHGETILCLLLLSGSNYLIRFLRWRRYLKHLEAAIDWTHDLRIYIGGFALTATPGKSGELARTLWLRPYGVAVRSSAAVFLVERLQDLIAMVLLASLGLWLYPEQWWLLAAVIAVILAGAGILSSMRALHASATRHMPGPLRQIAQRLLQVSRDALVCLSPRLLLFGLAAGLLAWSLESVELSVLLDSLGHPIPVSSSVSIYAFSMLAGAVSFLPGGLGSSEACMVLLLRAAGIQLPVAVSATLIVRAATLWFAVLLGALALAIPLRSAPSAAAEASSR